MNWNKIYTKYKDTELMKEFEKYVVEECNHFINLDVVQIQFVWGWIICFAETKEGMVSRLMVQFAFDINIAENPLTVKEAMIRSAEVFFEEAK